MRLECLEDCLKYVLLLNFEEEPKYDYLLEQLKNAYCLLAMETGDRPTQEAFSCPVFDWSVSLATRLQKELRAT